MLRLKLIIRVIALSMIFGGIVRLVANKSLFENLGMGELWVDHAYFIYIYRMLGTFVIILGLLFYSISKQLSESVQTISSLKWALLLAGIILAISGFATSLPFYVFAPDFIFCFILSYILFKTKTT